MVWLDQTLIPNPGESSFQSNSHSDKKHKTI